MLRKDVKLGFAIGGIMLAVVIVYVLVVPGGDRKNVSVVTDESQSPTKTDVAPLPMPSDSKPAETETADKTNAPPADSSKVDPTKTETAQAPATMPSSVVNTTPASGSANGSASGSDWNKLLAEGSSSPTMMSETPSLESKKPAAQADAVATDKPVADQPIADNAVPSAAAVASAVDKSTPDLSVDTASTPATQPTDSSQRTHIVASGEMLTTIASAAYGDSRKWKKIAAANPNVNPNRLTVGTKLVIPALGNAFAGSSKESSGSSASAANLDSQTQYEVQANDSLYRISMKLYGKADHVDKLYDANKDVIGSDPKRLKLHMVLKLSDPPTAGSVTASR